VAGTSNLHWKNLAGRWNGCSGIEYSNISTDEPGTFTFSGYMVSDIWCLAYGNYTFDLSEDGLSLSGIGEYANVPMTLTRTPDQDCFVGHWYNENNPDDGDWLAHISVDAFPHGSIPDDYYTCDGFQAPAHDGPIKVKKNRVIPMKASLLTLDGDIVEDTELAALPVIQVVYQGAGSGDATDVSGEALPAGQGSEGNQFEWNGAGWQFNLMTKNYSAPGTYTVFMETGDATAYAITPTCMAEFTIE
jgi:hypothetical protein